jgi:hypothetical protein
VKKRTKKWMAVVLSAQALAAGASVPALAAQPAQDSVQGVQRVADQTVSVKPGAVKGTVFEPTTKKPWAKVSVELIDPSSGKVLSTVQTDDQGAYSFGDVKEGKYLVRVAGKVTLPLEVAPGAEAGVLNLAVPTAVMGTVAMAVTWTTVAVVGAGVVTAAAVPVMAAGASNGGSHGSVSPS